MAEAILLGQNNGSNGGSSDLVNLMDFYDTDKWEWHIYNENFKTLLSNTLTPIINETTSGYLFSALMLSNSTTSGIFQIKINNKNYYYSSVLTNSGIGGASRGIDTLSCQIANSQYGSNPFGITEFSSRNKEGRPFTGEEKITQESTSYTLYTFFPLPFDSLVISYANPQSISDDSKGIYCIYVTKKS